MPKNQSTAAQSARKASRNGSKYTAALRRATNSTAQRAPHVLRFLAQRPGDLYHLIGGIAAAWAHSGQRVLLLEEAEDRWSRPLGRRRNARQRTGRTDPPEPTTSTLWASPHEAGTAVHHTCVWEARHRAADESRGLPCRDRGPLATTVASAVDDYDVIVLLPAGGWSYPDRDIATAHVAIGQVDVFPHVDCRVVLPGGEETGVPLSPEQSAAVLRERCLDFLFGAPHLPLALEGVIWQPNWELPVDAAYRSGVDQDMNRVGLQPLGWAPCAPWPIPYRRLPEQAQLEDTRFARQYQPIANRLGQALSARPADEQPVST